jgi:hypothetical protein
VPNAVASEAAVDQSHIRHNLPNASDRAIPTARTGGQARPPVGRRAVDQQKMLTPPGPIRRPMMMRTMP